MDTEGCVEGSRRRLVSSPALLRAAATASLSVLLSGALREPAEAQAARPVERTAVRFSSGDIPLAADLLVPDGHRPFPAVVLVHGSGSSDRRNAWGGEIAAALAQRGVAVLFPDKRGSGESGGDWRTADFSDLAADALAGVEFLRSDARVDPERIGLVGLSQGGRVVPLAAATSPKVAFVVNVSGSAVNFVEQITHESRNTFRKAGLDDEQLSEAMALHAVAEEYIRGGSWERYNTLRERAVAGSWASVARDFPASPDDWRWAWWRRVIDYDPLPHWRRIAVPAFIAYGELDENDNVPVAESVRRLEQAFRESGHRPNVVIRVFPNSGHALREPGTSVHRVRADFLDALADWIRGVSGRSQSRRGY